MDTDSTWRDTITTMVAQRRRLGFVHDDFVLPELKPKVVQAVVVQ